MKTIKIEIEGVTALLMHSPQGMLKLKPPPGSKKPEIPAPEEEAEAGAYRFPDGKLGIPTSALRGCMLHMARELPHPTAKRLTLKSAIGGTTMILPEDGYVQILREGKQLDTYDEIDLRTAVVQRNRVVRARARVNCSWNVIFELLWDNEVLPSSMPVVFRQLWDKAGQICGLLDFRPGSPKSPGWFGKFRVVSFEQI